MSSPNILQAIQSAKLFSRWFAGETWQAWRAFLAALFGLPMSEEEGEIFRRHTGRADLPTGPSSEGWLVVGRRGGKSLIAALVALFLACFRSYERYLAPGEVATIMVIAADKRQARVIMRYVNGFLDAIPMLGSMVTQRTKERLELRNRVVIEIHICSFRTVRGYTIAAVICDEIAYWRSDESANPDTEILNALRPGMATIPGALLLCISSPYARRGALWEAYKQHFGKDGDRALVWQANTLSMNPSIDPSIIERAFEEDESVASAEYGAEFRRDIETFISRETVDACIVPERLELPYCAQFNYVGFTDPSGGSADSFTLAISHSEGGKVILDAIRERKPPFSPDAVTQEFAELLKAYKIGTVQGDRYAGEWPRERFSKHGITYEPSEKVKSDIYRDLLPMLNSGQVELLDHKRLYAQLCGLERRTARGGKDIVDHPSGGHDDLSNAAAGALVLVQRECGVAPEVTISSRRPASQCAGDFAGSGRIFRGGF